MRALAAVLAAAMALAGGAPVRADDEAPPVPANVQVSLLFKALTFERNLVERSGGELIIGVVYVPGDRLSERAKDAIAETLREAATKTVKKLPIRSVMLPYTSAADLEQAVKAERVGVLYVTPGNSGHLDTVLKVSQARRIITVTGVPEYVKRGVALGVGRGQDQNELIINLRSARSEGSDFDSRLLRTAIVL